VLYSTIRFEVISTAHKEPPPKASPRGSQLLDSVDRTSPVSGSNSRTSPS
jgi:hypothetical protein